ncbi:MAG: tetratricopeptide repeat protein [Methylotenera sp.]
MSDVLLRQIEMLRMIPHNKKMTTVQIKGRLDSLGYVTTERTIQRDLNELSRKMPIVCDDTKKPYKWSWSEYAGSFDISSNESEEIRILQNVLQPTTSESKISQHLSGFVGRKWIFDAYHDWLENNPKSRLFWIKAGPGVGKSAIAANLIQNKREAIYASWFCDAKSSERKDPSSVLRSIAFQLALRWAGFRHRLLRKLQLYVGATDESCNSVCKELRRKSTKDLFDVLLTEPMMGLSWNAHKLVIIVDALDEAVDDQGNNWIAGLLSNELNSLPEWISFVVTSRPEPNVISRMLGFKPFEIDIDDPFNLADLRCLYRMRIGQRPEITGIPEIEQQRIENMLIERSEGMILYLKVVEESFIEGSLNVANLQDIKFGLPGLCGRYYDSFQVRFGNNYEDSVKSFIRLLIAAGGPLPEDLVCETLGWNIEQLLDCRNRLGSYAIENDNCYELFHKTLADWLKDRASGPFYVDCSLGRQMLTDVLVKELDKAKSHLLRWKTPIREWLPAWLPQMQQYDDATLLNKLGMVYVDWADYSIARPILERALDIREKTLGLNHLDTAYSLNSLALLLMTIGRYVEAEPMFRRSLEILEAIYGIDHFNTSNILNNLAVLLNQTGDHVTAELLNRRALAVDEKFLGYEHTSIATALTNIASMSIEKGDYATAEPLAQRALTIYEKHFGPEHPDVARSLNLLASSLLSKGEYATAEKLLHRALAIREKTYGHEHPDTANSLASLSMLLFVKGDYKTTEQLLRQALVIKEKCLGSDHPDIADIFNSLAIVLETAGKSTR